ncbi:MAG: c-type cytochrome biogenesis protein CcsB [Dehalococcoidales bacterium]|nr:c-type cytochrome biogenesis protein CcsB [Dehalococcoidales bacterium]
MWEVLLFWIATALYAVSSVLYTAGFVFGWRKGPDLATWLAAVGLLPHLAGIVVRWIAVGHGPYLNFYEVTISDTLVAVTIFVFLAWRYPRVRPAGIVVLPLSFLLIGAGIFSPHEGREVIPIMKSFWLGVHVTFAKLAYGSYLFSFALAILRIVKGRQESRQEIYGPMMARLPSPMVMDDLALKAISFGFVMHSIMIFSGSIWANEAWGNYWSWEPIETWAFLSWLVYGIVLHLRLVHGWQGNRAAIAAIASLVVVIFAFFGVPLVFSDSHAPILGL